MPTIGATALAACSSMLTRKSDATADILGETLDGAGQGGAVLTGTIYLPDERISVVDSVRAYTKGSAFAAFHLPMPN